MNKAKSIGQIRTRAERDPSISDGALRLLLRICSHIYTNPKATLEKPFPLPWSTVAVWCFLKDADACARRISELVDNGYLKCDGLRGCPPINHFFLTPNYPSGAVIDYPAKGAIDSGSRGAINSGSRGAHQISNSFQEEKIKGKRDGNNSSLRSKATKGDTTAAPPAARYLTDAERAQCVHDLAQLQKELRR